MGVVEVITDSLGGLVDLAEKHWKIALLISVLFLIWFFGGFKWLGI